MQLKYEPLNGIYESIIPKLNSRLPILSERNVSEEVIFAGATFRVPIVHLIILYTATR